MCESDKILLCGLEEEAEIAGRVGVDFIDLTGVRGSPAGGIEVCG